jgi:hypothetical protein
MDSATDEFKPRRRTPPRTGSPTTTGATVVVAVVVEAAALVVDDTVVGASVASSNAVVGVELPVVPSHPPAMRITATSRTTKTGTDLTRLMQRPLANRNPILVAAADTGKPPGRFAL